LEHDASRATANLSCDGDDSTAKLSMSSSTRPTLKEVSKFLKKLIDDGYQIVGQSTGGANSSTASGPLVYTLVKP
jgi:hypothetical protein